MEFCASSSASKIFVSHGGLALSEATVFTLTEKIQEQKRFFCENCRREAFLAQKYCDNCGGKIEWPKEYEKIRNIAIPQSEGSQPTFAPATGQGKRKRWFFFRR
jgi:hypothetical protein